jgi:ketosteroid isomerase-like protein
MENKQERRSFFKRLLPFSAFVAGTFLLFRSTGPSNAYGKGNDNARMEALEKRIQAMEDIEAIKQLQYRYKNAFMQAQWDVVLGCFAQDAVIDMKPDGTNVGMGFAEVKRQFGNMAKVHVGAETDFIYHPEISVDGNKAKATWMVTDNMHVIDQPVQSIYGIYTMEYKKADGEWKISLLRHRHRTITPSEPLGPPED